MIVSHREPRCVDVPDATSCIGMYRAFRIALAALAVGSAVVATEVAMQRSANADHTDLIVEKIPVDDSTFTLELVASGLQTPLWGAGAPYSTRQLFVADQVGRVTALPIAGDGEPHTFLDVGPSGANVMVTLKTEGFEERGLLGLAFHPHYRKNGLVYTYTSEPRGPVPDFTTLADHAVREADASLSVIREWRVDDPRRLDAVVDTTSSRVLLQIEQPQNNHNAGALVFGPDAMLYIALGDGGSRDDEGLGHAPGGNGQDLGEGNVLGKILRIDPLGAGSDNGRYGIPADNPFVDADGADEIFAYGFRNPFRISFDHRSGRLYVADVGQRDVEEINRVVAGGNYGWPIKEGTFLFNANGEANRGFAGEDSRGQPPGMVDPIAQYDHDEGTSVTGGFVYHGDQLDAFTGSYLFGDLTRDGDLVAGRFFRLSPADELSEIIPTNHASNRLLITGFGRDTQGELYVMGIQPANGDAGGVVYRLAPVS